MTTSVTSRGGDAGARVADGIRRGILDGTFAPGARIRQESIAEQFGASRVPVREALRTLENEGLVTLVANTGAWVSTRTLAECTEVYQMRERLEPLLLRYSAPHLTDDDYNVLDSLVDEMARASELATFLELDRRFHLACYRGAETNHLGELVTKLWNSTQSYRRAYSEGMSVADRRVIDHEHQLLAWELRAGRIAEAERILRGHIRRTRKQLANRPELFDEPA